MRSIFHPYLPNGPSGDPALWIDLPDDGHSILVDLGNLSRIPNRKLLRVDRVVVSHTHIDHFVGFDHLLRLVLSRRERELVLTGPPGFLRNVQGKIDGYTWNLIGSYPVRLVVQEVDGEILRSVTYTGAGEMHPEPLSERPYGGTIEACRAYTLQVDLLDHGIPVLGVVLHETVHLSVNKDRLETLGLQPGPWLAGLKEAVRRRETAGRTVCAATTDGGEREVSCNELAAEILCHNPGQKIAYFTDLGHTPENVRRVVELARDADLMICEAAFLHEDEALARDRFHLTARQAGELARAAGARRLAVFHFSPRYQGRETELIDEATRAFRGPVVHLPQGPVL